MFRRRRGRHRGGPGYVSDVDSTGEDEDAAAADEGRRDGPWDAGEPVPEMDRVDLGSLLVPTGDDLQVQANLADDRIVAVTVVQGPNALQLQALAAPKTSGVWQEVRTEVTEELRRTGGSAEEADGPFGIQLRARVPIEQGSDPRPARFVGVDGPRWLLRGVFTGPAADDPVSASRLEDVFRGVVVIRGDAPVPPRELLDLRLPPRTGEAEDDAPEEDSGRPRLGPFGRGPEITETR